MNYKTIILFIILLVSIISIINIYSTRDNYIQFNYKNNTYKEKFSLRDYNDVLEKREKLIKFIWNEKGFPKNKLPSSIEKDFKDSFYGDIKNLKQIDKISIKMDNNFTSTIYHFLPEVKNNRLILYQQGLDHKISKRVTQYFVARGYEVLALSMPLYGINNDHYNYKDPEKDPVIQEIYPIKRILPNGTEILLDLHNDFYLYDNKTYSMLQIFLEPVHISLNYVSNKSYEDISMIGLSAGSTVTLLAAAIDPRIQRSYPVAGNIFPEYLKYENERGLYENEVFLKTINYPELYVLSTCDKEYERRQLQIFLYKDTFSNESREESYSSVMKEKIKEICDGNFDTYSDRTTIYHLFSDHVLNLIKKDIENKEYYVNVTEIKKEISKLGYNPILIKEYPINYSGVYVPGILIRTPMLKSEEDFQKIMVSLAKNSFTEMYMYSAYNTKKRTDYLVILPRKVIGDEILKINDTYFSVQPTFTIKWNS